MKQTYCTRCKTNVEIINAKYIKLANSRLAIEGYCAICSTKLLKTKVMPKSGKKKKILKRKKGRIKGLGSA
jgi:hypothetical protein